MGQPDNPESSSRPSWQTLREGDVYRRLAEMVDRGEDGVLATVVGTHLSAPRHPGSKMIVHTDGSVTGTIGGGAAEALVIERADDVRASVSTGLSEDREVRSSIEWKLSKGVSVQGRYDNANNVSSSAVGNIGADLRWRIEFE